MTHAITSATRQAINSRSVPVLINCRIISNVFAMSKTNAAMPAAISKNGGRKRKGIPNNQQAQNVKRIALVMLYKLGN